MKKLDYYKSIRDGSQIRRLVAIPAGQFDRYRDEIMAAFGYSAEADFGETGILPVYEHETVSIGELEAADVLA